MCVAHNMNSLNVSGGCNHKIITLIIVAWRYRCAMKSYRERGIYYFLLETGCGSSEKRKHLNSNLKKKKKLLNCWSKRYKIGNLMLE